MPVVYTSFADEVEAATEAASVDAAEAMADRVADESQTLVPVDTGALQRSMRKLQTGDSTFAITYGGPDARYAPVVHDKPGVRYRNGQWQYLRQPLMNARAALDTAGAAYKEHF